MLHVAVGGIEQEAGAVGLDVEDASDRHELARCDVDRSGACRSVLLTHRAIAALAAAATST